MKLSTIPIANPAVIMQAVVDEAVLVNSDTASSLALNPTGVILWGLINGRRSRDEIIAEMQREMQQMFDDVPDTVGDDVIALLDILVEDGFVGYEVLNSDV